MFKLNECSSYSNVAYQGTVGNQCLAFGTYYMYILLIISGHTFADSLFCLDADDI